MEHMVKDYVWKMYFRIQSSVGRHNPYKLKWFWYEIILMKYDAL